MTYAAFPTTLFSWMNGIPIAVSALTENGPKA